MGIGEIFELIRAGGSNVAWALLIVVAIYIYFDIQYKKKLESNHFKTIEGQFNDLDRKLCNSDAEIEKRFNAVFLRVDELRSYSSEFSKEIVRLNSQFSERTAAMQRDIEKLNKKVFNGYKGD